MKRHSLLLIFLLSLIAGVFIELVSSGELMAGRSSVVYAPRYIPDIDYSASTVVSGELININTASVSELDLLHGIGKEYAKRIIKYRTVSGKFEVPEDLMKVAGIGEKRFLEIKDKISVE